MRAKIIDIGVDVDVDVEVDVDVDVDEASMSAGDALGIVREEPDF